MEIHCRSCTFPASSDPDKIKERAAKANPGAIVQTVGTRAASNGYLVEMIAAQTLRAKSTGNLLAKKPEIDLLLRLAHTTQISKAIREIGSARGDRFLLVVASQARLKREPGVLGGKLLPKGPLSEKDFDRVEESALLNAVRA